jgi:acyl-CoA thioesterase
MPAVSPPEQGDPFELPFSHPPTGSFVERMERFLVPEQPALIAEGRAAMWIRVPGWPIGSAASQGFVADIVPMALGMALGQMPGGTSLDNTVRIVLEDPTDDWILLDIEAEGMNRSIGCGRVRMWRRDGTLIGVGTQSAIIRTSHHPPPP